MTNKIEEEIWKVYPDYPFVEVSNLGNVRTKDRYVPNGKNSKRLVKGRVLKQQLLPNGYIQVRFGVDCKYVHLYIHRAVAICFIPNPNNYPEVNHIDCNRINNRVDNLEWCTPEYNIAYREKHGIALNHPVIAINPETSEVFRFESQSEAGRQLGADQSAIAKVTKGKLYKTTGGCWFCNVDENAVEKVRIKFGDEVAKKVEDLMKSD